MREQLAGLCTVVSQYPSTTALSSAPHWKPVHGSKANVQVKNLVPLSEWPWITVKPSDST
jgi:hypothetical protein